MINARLNGWSLPWHLRRSVMCAGYLLLAGLVLTFACAPAFGVEAGRDVAFGKAELNGSFAGRGIKPPSLVVKVIPGTAGSYKIQPGSPAQIIGGDDRGLMYGLLAAADQIRKRGTLLSESGSPKTDMRGIRYFINNEAMEKEWYYSKAYWDEYFRMLAYNRFNRFNLVFGASTGYLVPPYPFWVDIPKFPEIRVPGLTAEQRDRNLQMLQYISQDAADHGIDFTLGVWEQHVWPSMKPSVEGFTDQNFGPYIYAALKKVLQLCPAITSVQIRSNSESGIPKDQQVTFYTKYFFPAIHDVGRPVILDLRAWLLAPGMLEQVKNAGIPLRISAKYWAEFLGRPYPPATTWENYSYGSLLVKPRGYQYYWELWGSGADRLLLWGNPDYVRWAVSTFSMGDAVGFEIDPPMSMKGFGNRPETWGVFTSDQQQRVFWKWEFQRYWMYYKLWGRLSYDPATPDTVWQDQLKTRFGEAAAPAVLEAYKEGSLVLTEYVAAHLEDPNLYLWPEINPGALIDDYIGIRSSDWSYIASISEAIQNHLNGTASAKQTPLETAALLDSIASKIEAAIAQADAKIVNPSRNKEWQSSKEDFTVLDLLARYHALKLKAGDHLEYFYKTGDGPALEAAKSDTEKAVATWEHLVRVTDGVYPEQMSFAPDDQGDWKDKLPYARYDLELIKEREAIFKRFGRFDYGFDFGAPDPEYPLVSRMPYRYTRYVQHNTVEPRFTYVSPTTAYQDSTGFGWVGDSPREAVGITLTPYLEVRSADKNPTQLPHDVLFRDYIRGKSAQQFRVKADPGEYTVFVLHPDHTDTEVHLQTKGDSLTIPFPAGDWSVSGLVIKGARSAKAPVSERWASLPPRPTFTHTAPKTAVAGEPLKLTLGISPKSEVSTVRLYYRPENQLAEFKMLEANPDQATFTIPAADIPSNYDFMYYFEVLDKEKGGWFSPDPRVTTPYYVVKTTSSGKP